MKAYTVYQPYAYATVAGLKGYETRPRRTNIRGRVAVHAGKMDEMRETKSLSDRDFWALMGAIGGKTDLPRGAVVGTVEIVDCVPVEEIMHTLTERERLLGDFSPGRFAWVLQNPVMFDEPFPARGKQGWWNWDEIEACRGRIQKATYQLGLNFFNGVTPGSDFPAAEVLRNQSADFLNQLRQAGEIKIGPGLEDITLGNISLDVLPLIPVAFPEISDRGTYRIHQNGEFIGTVKYKGTPAEEEPGKVQIGPNAVFTPAEKARYIQFELTYNDPDKEGEPE